MPIIACKEGASASCLLVDGCLELATAHPFTHKYLLPKQRERKSEVVHGKWLHKEAWNVLELWALVGF